MLYVLLFGTTFEKTISKVKLYLIKVSRHHHLYTLRGELVAGHGGGDGGVGVDPQWVWCGVISVPE